MLVTALLNLVIGLLATVLVFTDTLRRDLSPRTQAGWTGFVAAISIGGSLAVAIGDDALYRLVMRGSDPALVVTPLAFIAGVIIAGLTLSALAVLTYGVGSRYGPFAAA
ncbi:hypothetical protein EGH24_01995 [Halonotius terrestris]|uniref:Uncharacterized protein n=1 Tax=Halonotius terrestris TaxID=2487750 RepID=A0A8J8PBD9_9EURY|nr:hypothetical protein [Halonotius terrestris]TQQ83587.1 hypothetical protein EGH24_01995 [Halonotius terrestris]